MTNRSVLFGHFTLATSYMVASFLIARFLGLRVEYLAFSAVGSVFAASSSIRVGKPVSLLLTLFTVTIIAPILLLIIVAEIIQYDWSFSVLLLDTNWRYMIVPFASGMATIFGIRHWAARG